jgi:hypothetical protein
MMARATRTLIFIVVVLSGLVTSGGCTQEGVRGCTEIGCESALEIELPDSVRSTRGDVTIEHSLDDVSSTWSFESGKQVPLHFSLTPKRRGVRLSILVRDDRGIIAFVEDRALTMKVSQPNGEGCPPTCYTGSMNVPANDPNGDAPD